MAKKRIWDPHPTPFFWCYYILALVAAVLAVVIAPVWDKTDVFFKSYGARAIDVLVAVALAIYIAAYLIRAATREGSTAIRVLLAVEIAILALIAVGCVLKQLQIIRVGSAAEVLGVVIWLRGVVLAARAYCYHNKYSLFHLAVALALVTVGAVLVVKPLFTVVTLRYIVAVTVLVLALLLAVLGVRCKPRKKK